MKVTITFKSPDAVDDSMLGLPQNEQNKVKTILEKYVEYGEYVHLEVDTKTQEVKLLPV